jgi:hypothetical protein
MGSARRLAADVVRRLGDRAAGSKRRHSVPDQFCRSLRSIGTAYKEETSPQPVSPQIITTVFSQTRTLNEYLIEFILLSFAFSCYP